MLMSSDGKPSVTYLTDVFSTDYSLWSIDEKTHVLMAFDNYPKQFMRELVHSFDLSLDESSFDRQFKLLSSLLKAIGDLPLMSPSSIIIQSLISDIIKVMSDEERKKFLSTFEVHSFPTIHARLYASQGISCSFRFQRPTDGSMNENPGLSFFTNWRRQNDNI